MLKKYYQLNAYLESLGFKYSTELKFINKLSTYYYRAFMTFLVIGLFLTFYLILINQFDTVWASSGSVDETFRTIVNKFRSILTGTGGILISFIALLSAAVMAVSGRFTGLFIVLVVILILTMGPNIVESFFGLALN